MMGFDWGVAFANGAVIVGVLVVVMGLIALFSKPVGSRKRKYTRRAK